MRSNNIFLAIILICFLGIACVELFQPETVDYNDMLFIESLLTDDSSIPSKVIISRSAPLLPPDAEGNGTRLEGFSTFNEGGAIVQIHCDDGNIYLLDEVDLGQYTDIDNSLQAEYGKQYKITIQTIDGNIFESEYEELRQSPPIDSITYSTRQKKISDVGMIVFGYQFYINTHDPQPGPGYYRWVLDATYSYYAPLNSTHIWLGGQRVELMNDSVKNCWKSVDVKGIFTATTKGLTENTIINSPLHFVSQYGDQLSMKYSLHVVQYAITKSAYEFWSDLDRLVNQTGGLYETQPFQIEGNIKCITDPSLNVAGIFELASVSEIRSYANRPSDFKIVSSNCNIDTVGTEELPWEDLKEETWLMESEEGVYTTSWDYCFDCSLKGGTLVKPPFWIY